MIRNQNAKSDTLLLIPWKKSQKKNKIEEMNQDHNTIYFQDSKNNKLRTYLRKIKTGPELKDGR